MGKDATTKVFFKMMFFGAKPPSLLPWSTHRRQRQQPCDSATSATLRLGDVTSLPRSGLPQQRNQSEYPTVPRQSRLRRAPISPLLQTFPPAASSRRLDERRSPPRRSSSGVPSQTRVHFFRRSFRRFPPPPSLSVSRTPTPATISSDHHHHSIQPVPPIKNHQASIRISSSPIDNPRATRRRSSVVRPAAVAPTRSGLPRRLRSPALHRRELTIAASSPSPRSESLKSLKL
ncbi:uncharacterized protein LOC126797105 [Argentina anserina]|uniref:uncharacterized protein LOC126797105 n=1 Tax=Argentina anserina TaxID=57926 RepID=UPI002176560C|nr:uncharacterized protein LOC126797105 [Potentilla anserina]